MAVPAGAPTSKRQASAPGAEDELGGDAKRPSSAGRGQATIASTGIQMASSWRYTTPDQWQST
jgi:hypothetical protein